MSGLWIYKYVSWSDRAHRGARILLHATQPLEWIQQAQAHCLETKGRYCSDLAELVETAGDELDGDGRDTVETQAGRAGDPNHYGARYRYSIEQAGAEGFEALASSTSSKETWTIGPEGAPIALTPPVHPGEGLPHETPVGWAAVVALAIHIGLLTTSALAHWKRSEPGPLRFLVTSAFLVVGLLVPFGIVLFITA